MSDADASRETALAHLKAGVRDSMLVEYRCRGKGCKLLMVWQSPNGPEFAIPGQKLSGRMAQRPGETWDWAGRISDYPGTTWIPLVCDHIKESTTIADVIKDSAGRTPGRPHRAIRG